jgi:hypothetical protein
VIWQIEALVKIVENDGNDIEKRLGALKGLLDFCTNEQVAGVRVFDQIVWDVIRKAFKILIEAPPELTVEMMRFFRNQLADPHLIRILVHFLYPYGNDRTTPKVRVETVRAPS